MQARGAASITVAVRFSVSLLASAESLFLWGRLHLKLSKNVWHVAFLLLVLSVSVATVVPVTRPQISSPWWLRVDPETLSCGFPNCCLTFTVYVEGASGDYPVHVTFTGSDIQYDERFTSLGMPAPFQFTVTHDCAPLWCPYEITVWAWDNLSTPIPNGEDLHNHTVKVKFVSGGGEPPCEHCPRVTFTTYTWSGTPHTSFTWRTTAYTWTYTTRTYDWWDWWQWWRWDWRVGWWPWTAEEFDFSLHAQPASQSMKAGESASFTTDVRLVSGIAQPVTLSLSGLPGGMSYSFSLPSANPRFTSALRVSSQSSVSPGTYPVTIVGTGGGKTHSISVNLVVLSAENKQSSSLSLSVSPPSLKVGESVALGGALSPSLATTVELVYTRPDGFELVKHVATSGAGAFSDAFKPDMPGPWSVKARWPGDADHYACESQTQSFSVEPPPEQPPSVWEQIMHIMPTVALVALAAIIVTLALVLVRRRSAHRLRGATAVKARFCTKCGTTIPERSGYCPNCGEKI